MSVLEEITEAFVAGSRAILQNELTGVYLHGSAVMGCFNPQKSDIDLIVVVKNELNAVRKRAFMDMVVRLNASAPPKGIEMSIVRQEVCRPFIYPTPYELHFSNTHLAWYHQAPDDYIRRMNGTDIDLAAHFTIIEKHGKCLYGLPIEEVFSPVPRKDYIDSIRQDIAQAEEAIIRDPMYLILNLARVLAFLNEDAVLSKKEGGEWALQHLPQEYHTLLDNALAEYTKEAHVIYDPERSVQYARYMLTEIKKKQV